MDNELMSFEQSTDLNTGYVEQTEEPRAAGTRGPLAVRQAEIRGALKAMFYMKSVWRANEAHETLQNIGIVASPRVINMVKRELGVKSVAVHVLGEPGAKHWNWVMD
jgi:hypothetical protein